MTDPALVESSQLRVARRTTYLAPQGGLSPLQALIELALPERNTAISLFGVSTEGFDPSKVILQRRVTGNVFNRGRRARGGAIFGQTWRFRNRMAITEIGRI